MNSSSTAMLLLIGTAAPPKPDNCPLCSVESGAKATFSLRCSYPKFIPRPSLAVGDLIPYAPSSPVMSACAVRRVVLPAPVPFTYRWLSAACVTPPSWNIFHGTQGGPLTHTEIGR